MIEDRAYQTFAIDAVKRAILDGHRRILLCCPTAGGKTILASRILKGLIAKGNLGSFVAHRKELLDQTVKTLERVGVANVSVIRANDPREDRSKPLQVASVQTLARRPPMSPAPHIIFIDECHRAASDSYKTYLFEAYPNAIFLGLSATPGRSDGRPLGGELFSYMIQVATYSELIRGGFVSAPTTYSTPLLADLTKVRTVAGDYNQEDLEKAVNKGHIIADIVGTWLRRAGGRRTVCFAVSVEHSKSLTAAFVAKGVKAEHLDGTTPEEEREAILARLKSGETTVVTNCGILVEGWDAVWVKVCILACPTKSIIKYMQCGGRVLRPWEGVTPIILDHAGCHDRFGGPVHLDRIWSLTDKVKLASTVPPMRSCPVCFASILSALPACPHCGATMPAPVAPKPKERKIVPVDLALRELPELTEAERSWMEYTLGQARRLGWHWKALENRFSEHFAKPFPPELKALVSAEYKRDEAWKANRKKRADAKKDPQTVLRPSP